MNTFKRGGSHMTLGQKELLIDFLETNPKLNSGKFDNIFSFKDATALWQKISEKLNAMPGAYKDWKGWRKAWYDMKGCAKLKSTELRKHQGGTGGGHRLNVEISPLEQRILNLLGPTSLTGDNNIMETTINLEDYQRSTLNAEVINPANIDIISVEPIEMTVSIQNNEIPVESQTSTPPIRPKKRKRRVEARLEYSKAATAAFETKCQKEMDLKSEYYEKKIKVLERMAKAKEDKAKSIAHIAEAAMTMAIVLAGGSVNVTQSDDL